jgi:Fe-S cluster biosynthesis and repair protein YggX
MSIMIDIPQVAYKTWMLEYRIYDENNNRMRFMECEAEQDLEKSLRDYKYSEDHDHVR